MNDDARKLIDDVLAAMFKVEELLPLGATSEQVYMHEYLLPVEGAQVVLTHDTIDGITVITVNCRDYDHYKILHDVMTYRDTLLGKTGWNSDKCYACYQSNASILHTVK